MQVSEIMTREVVSVGPDDKLVYVANVLERNGFNGVPVVEGKKVLGMITENDLISRGSTSFHIPSLIRIFKDLQLDKSKINYSDSLESILKARAESVMNRDYVSVSPETKIIELVKVFQEKKVNPIPVVNKEKELVGIISMSDVLKILGYFQEQEIDFLSSFKEN